jgi:SAM-dependent methyltransferase
MAVWHEEDRFWETMPMFSAEHWAQAPAQVEVVIALLGLGAGAAVLDMPCGTGRHSLEFARRGYRVTGVDRTAAYLAEARERAAAEGLAIEWLQADMRQFVRPEVFDVAINLYTSFGYFEDPAEDRQVAQNLCRCLRPGGALVMDLMGKEPLARIFQAHDWQELDDGTFYLQERKVVRDWTWFENRWILIRPDGQRHEFAVSHRIYDGAALRALLREAGFETVDLYGGLDGAPYDHRARRLVAVARKAGAGGGPGTGA